MIWKVFTLFTLAGLKDCSNGLGRAKVTSLTAVPEVPVAGDNYTITVAYDLPEPAITGGTAEYSATLNYIPVYTEKFDLCTQTACPKEVGPNTEVSVSQIPSISGKLVSTVKWMDQDNNLVWCFESTIKL